MDPNKKEALLGTLREISLQFTIQEDSRSQIAEILVDASAKHGMKKPALRKLAKMYHKRNGQEFIAETSELGDIYTEIVTA